MAAPAHAPAASLAAPGAAAEPLAPAMAPAAAPQTQPVAGRQGSANSQKHECFGVLVFARGQILEFSSEYLE